MAFNPHRRGLSNIPVPSHPTTANKNNTNPILISNATKPFDKGPGNRLIAHSCPINAFQAPPAPIRRPRIANVEPPSLMLPPSPPVFNVMGLIPGVSDDHMGIGHKAGVNAGAGIAKKKMEQMRLAQISSSCPMPNYLDLHYKPSIPPSISEMPTDVVTVSADGDITFFQRGNNGDSNGNDNNDKNNDNEEHNKSISSTDDSCSDNSIMNSSNSSISGIGSSININNSSKPISGIGAVIPKARKFSLSSSIKNPSSLSHSHRDSNSAMSASLLGKSPTIISLLKTDAFSGPGSSARVPPPHKGFPSSMSSSHSHSTHSRMSHSSHHINSSNNRLSVASIPGMSIGGHKKSVGNDNDDLNDIDDPNDLQFSFSLEGGDDMDEMLGESAPNDDIFY